MRNAHRASLIGGCRLDVFGLATDFVDAGCLVLDIRLPNLSG
jgi:FixJ family two-component response regulator